MTSQPQLQPLSRDELLELYKVAIDEYRFQVNLNWNRTQYYFVLNAGIIGVATGLLNLSKERTPWMIGFLYLAGLLCCCLSLAATKVQQTYYVASRDHKRTLEVILGLGHLGLTTTPGMGSTLRRLGRVTTFNAVSLSALGLINIAGVVVTIVK